MAISTEMVRPLFGNGRKKTRLKDFLLNFKIKKVVVSVVEKWSLMKKYVLPDKRNINCEQAQEDSHSFWNNNLELCNMVLK